MSCSQTNYKLDEAQAIFTELRSIKKAISTGEKERQDLIQVQSPAPPPAPPAAGCSLLTSSGRAARSFNTRGFSGRRICRRVTHRPMPQSFSLTAGG